MIILNGQKHFRNYDYLIRDKFDNLSQKTWKNYEVSK